MIERSFERRRTLLRNEPTRVIDDDAECPITTYALETRTSDAESDAYTSNLT